VSTGAGLTEDPPIADASLPVIPIDRLPESGEACVALVGNPNAGKTTLFNALTGLRAKTANFPGTTIERRSARIRLGGRRVELLDLPGLYSLSSATPEETMARDALLGRLPNQPRPTAIVVLLDATNLERNLYLASQALELRLPMVVALNMVDLAETSGIRVDAAKLSRELGCPVVPVVARSGRGVDRLQEQIERIVAAPERAERPAVPERLCGCSGCPFQARYDWAEEIGARCTTGAATTHGRQTERIDRVLTHPVVGVAAFLSVMFAVFGMIFWIARYPMDWIERGFAVAGGAAATWLPAGDLRSLVVDGVLGGVGGVLVFLPQICILFFFLSLLEDTGYLARAAFVMDRLMRRVGLPGRAFVPMLSAHACAVPAIMATRAIEDRRDRLVTILVLPLLTCAARIPVYAMLTALLFAARPLQASLVFTAAYALGVVAAVSMAFVFKRTILPGETKPLVLELPGYKLPGLRNALLTTYDRAWVFVKTAGSVILVFSVILWLLASYPKSEPPAEAAALDERAARLAAAGDLAAAEAAASQARRLTSQHALAQSLAGRMGRWIEPALEPLGFDWQIGVGIVSSFAAREVIVSTLAIVYGVGKADAEEHPGSLYEKLRSATRSDGTPVFTTATSVSLLVFYVLAMQCMSTLAVARRETGGWRWPAFQFAYMTALAYLAALGAHQLLGRWS
jgi:ferrous iron transport protein B